MLNFLKGKGQGSDDFPRDPATVGSPYIQAREFVDGHTEFIAWTCHPSLMLDERSTRIPQVIDSEGQSFTPQMGSLESGTEIPRFSSLQDAERAIRLYSENLAKRSIVREDLVSAEILHLEERLATLRKLLENRANSAALPDSTD
ncbi:hypothetical protein KDL44_13975 [bacterium]|nr:hypothetical protein [bacterium]